MFKRRRKAESSAVTTPDVAAFESEAREVTDFAAALRATSDIGMQFALIREAADRTIGLRAFDVQLQGAAALLDGAVVEMATGEGKTLVAVFPACIWALEGRGVHVLTANDYLARRDAEWMGPVYAAFGLSVGWVQQRSTPDERRAAYACDVTYAAATEAGFDYLRDRLVLDASEVVQRAPCAAIVDEVDSILIDEARIPLVIAGGAVETDALVKPAAAVVATLRPDEHFFVDADNRLAMLTETGFEHIAAELGDGDAVHLAVHHALQARCLLHRDVDYIVRDGALELVDEYKGRVAYQRRWPDGLQAAVEAKEGLVQTPEARILSAITMASYVRTYERVCGMTGTARASAAEFELQYGLKVRAIPTHLPVIRDDLDDVVFDTMAQKHAAVVVRVAELHAIGRPVLIGTGSVEESERISPLLESAGVPHQVLNARQDAGEAAVIARAGERGAVTLSTNMAGRGVDIRLGDGVAELGGLFVLGTNRHNARRIDQQLRGRAGRQGDPGTSQFYVSIEDPIITAHELSDLLTPEGDNHRRVEIAQAGVDWAYAQMRRSLAAYASIVEEQRRSVHAWRDELLHDGARREALLAIDDAWSHHLEHLRDLQETAATTFTSKTPFETFRDGAARSYVDLIRDLRTRVAEIQADPTVARDLPEPGATWSLLLTAPPMRSGWYSMRELMRSRWKQAW